MIEIEFFQAGVGIAARYGYSFAASPLRNGARSAHFALKNPGRFGATLNPKKMCMMSGRSSLAMVVANFGR